MVRIVSFSHSVVEFDSVPGPHTHREATFSKSGSVQVIGFALAHGWRPPNALAHGQRALNVFECAGRISARLV